MGGKKKRWSKSLKGMGVKGIMAEGKRPRKATKSGWSVIRKGVCTFGVV